MTAKLLIREAGSEDFPQIWPIFQEVATGGDTYAYPVDISYEDACRIWLEQPRRTYVAEADGRVVGTYYLKTNAGGNASHVCNCGYMVSSEARGMGLATRMCLHSQEVALELGYKAMQFNLVVSSNAVAVKLWEKLGFETVGCLPKAFNHPEQGYVDALVMYKWLA